MEKRSLNNVTDALMDFADKHRMINDSSLGHVANRGTKNQDGRQLLYPYMWIDYSTVTYDIVRTKGIGFKLYSMQICVLDKHTPNVRNSPEVMSDTEAILADAVQFFMTSQAIKDFRLDLTNIVAQPVRDEDKDGVEGWCATLNFKIPYAFCVTSLPIAP